MIFWTSESPITNMYDQIQEAANFIRSKWKTAPQFGIILGTGLGDQLPEAMKIETELHYGEIPHFVSSTVASHAGKFVCGMLSGKPVVAMRGRIHYYEGYSMQQLTFPVRVMKALGCDALIITNAAGGMNPQYQKGDIMIIEDHINLMGDNPLIGPNDDRLGERFPDMSEPYHKQLIEIARQVGIDNKIPLQKGVFVAVTGPNLETRAEYRFLRTIGADTVGMSTIPEVIVAVHSKMKVLGFSVVTDMCLPDALHPVSLQEIVAVANEAGGKLSRVIQGVVEKW
jgi:purine-nucleoside phosphorylase